MKSNRIAIVARGSGISLSVSAANTKAIFMVKTLLNYGLDSMILSSISYHQNKIRKRVFYYNGVRCFLPSIHPPTNSIVKRRLHKILHGYRVILFLLRLKLRGKKISYIFADNSVPISILYVLHLFGIIELVFNIEEWPIAHNIPKLRKLFSHIFVLISLNVCKKVICVSTFLMKESAIRNPKALLFKLPAITNIRRTKNNFPSVRSSHVSFLFCGCVDFREIIDLIISAYENVCELRKNTKCELVLILHGSDDAIDYFLKFAKNCHFSIKVKSGLSESELFSEYSNASALLAPLRNTLQDSARFPQKIAEYSAMAKPIITTMVGDIPLYFEADKNALIMEDFTVQNLQEKMLYVMDNSETCFQIGLSSHIVATKFFDYLLYVKTFGDFVTS